MNRYNLLINNLLAIFINLLTAFTFPLHPNPLNLFDVSVTKVNSAPYGKLKSFILLFLNDKSYSRYLLFIMAEITTISAPILKIDNQPELSLTLWSKSNAQYNTYIKAMGKRPDNIITDKKLP